MQPRNGAATARHGCIRTAAILACVNANLSLPYPRFRMTPDSICQLASHDVPDPQRAAARDGRAMCGATTGSAPQ